MLIAGMKFSNEYQRISKIRHEFSESDMNFLNQRCPLSACLMFTIFTLKQIEVWIP